MSKAKWIVTIFVLLSGFSQAYAYDEDTHFYGTYAMARYAGIRDDVAEKIALTTAWMDQSFISDPESLIALPLDGIKKRRLLHFPSSMQLSGLTQNTESTVVNHSLEDLEGVVQDALVKYLHIEADVTGISLFSKTQAGNEWATELLMRGLAKGDLMMAATSLHTLEDSFAHKGFPAEEGHFYAWHWPDRPFANVPKYEKMVHALFHALVAIRTQLPDSALDKSNQNYRQAADQLASSYFALVKPVISIDILKHPQYVHLVLSDFYQRAQAAGYIYPLLDGRTAEQKIQEVQSFNPNFSAYDAGAAFLGSVMNTTPQDPVYVNWPALLRSLGKDDVVWDSSDATKNFHTLVALIATYGDGVAPDANKVDVQSDAFNSFAKELIGEMFEYQIPHWHRTDEREMEDDTSNVRAMEMSLRNQNMKDFIAKTFDGKKIDFIFNATSDSDGFDKEIAQDPAAVTPIPGSDPDVPAAGSANTDYATFQIPEKYAFDIEIVNYLFPSMTLTELNQLVGLQRDMSVVKALRAEFKKEMKKAETAAKKKGIRQAAGQPKKGFFNHDWTISGLLGAADELDDVAKVELKYKGKGVNTVEYPVTMGKYVERIKRMAGKQEFRDFITDLVTHLTPSAYNKTYINPVSFKTWVDANNAPKLLGEKDVWFDTGSGLMINPYSSTVTKMPAASNETATKGND